MLAWSGRCPGTSARYSTLSAVSSMNASSSEARTAVSSCSRMPSLKARSPTCSVLMPRTSTAPSSSVLTVAPLAARARSSWSADGVRTRTDVPDDRAMKSCIVQSAISLPRPMTIR